MPVLCDLLICQFRRHLIVCRAGRAEQLAST